MMRVHCTPLNPHQTQHVVIQSVHVQKAFKGIQRLFDKQQARGEISLNIDIEQENFPPICFI